jgi:hypothetical protein
MFTLHHHTRSNTKRNQNATTTSSMMDAMPCFSVMLALSARTPYERYVIGCGGFAHSYFGSLTETKLK